MSRRRSASGVRCSMKKIGSGLAGPSCADRQRSSWPVGVRRPPSVTGPTSTPRCRIAATSAARSSLCTATVRKPPPRARYSASAASALPAATAPPSRRLKSSMYSSPVNAIALWLARPVWVPPRYTSNPMRRYASMPRARSGTQIITWSTRVSTRWPLLAGLAGRVVAVVHGQLQVLLRLVVPELGDGREGVDHRVLELAVLPLDLAHVDVLDRVAPVVELHRPARSVRDLHLAERGHELLAVLHGAANQLGRLVDPAAAGVAGLREIGRHFAVLLLVVGHELAVGRAVERGAVHERRHVAEGLVAEVGQDRLVDDDRAADDRQLAGQPRVAVLGREA